MVHPPVSGPIGLTNLVNSLATDGTRTLHYVNLCDLNSHDIKFLGNLEVEWKKRFQSWQSCHTELETQI